MESGFSCAKEIHVADLQRVQLVGKSLIETDETSSLASLPVLVPGDRERKHQTMRNKADASAIRELGLQVEPTALCTAARCAVVAGRLSVLDWVAGASPASGIAAHV